MNETQQASSVQCGLFGVSEDHTESSQSLDERFVKNAKSTFFFEARGESMAPLILPGDVLVVDRSVKPANTHIVIVAYEGELICKRLIFRNAQAQLVSENQKFRPILLSEVEELVVWGVVRAVVHPLLERGIHL